MTWQPFKMWCHDWPIPKEQGFRILESNGIDIRTRSLIETNQIDAATGRCLNKLMCDLVRARTYTRSDLVTLSYSIRAPIDGMSDHPSSYNENFPDVISAMIKIQKLRSDGATVHSPEIKCSYLVWQTVDIDDWLDEYTAIKVGLPS